LAYSLVKLFFLSFDHSAALQEKELKEAYPFGYKKWRQH
jgi:hypothetical protein